MITQLKPTNLIAVEVAPDANNYQIAGIWVFYDTNKNFWKQGDFRLPEGRFKILGEVTKDKIGFDVESYVDKYNNGAYREYKDNYPFYPDFDTPNICLTNEESLRSLLAANGLYFENPEGESYPYRFAESDGTLQTLDWHRNKWKEFKDKLIKGKLLILEKF